ncbi:MAG: hypothetical protein RLZ98_3156, partial [Pseudomonadota bacterium]
MAAGGDNQVFDRALLRARRRRAAPEMASADFLLAHVADDFGQRLEMIRREFPLCLNLGAHHGLVSRRLSGCAGIQTFVNLDDVPEVLVACDMPKVVADEETLPFAPQCFDLIVSGLKLQFVNDLPGVLHQARQVLKPDGLFLAAVLGPDTLKELRAAFLDAEAEILGGVSPRVAPFIEVRQAGALLQRAGFALPVADAEAVVVTYDSPLGLMRDLRAMGAANPLKDRSRLPTSRRVLSRMIEIYAERYADDDGRVRATF